MVHRERSWKLIQMTVHFSFHILFWLHRNCFMCCYVVRRICFTCVTATWTTASVSQCAMVFVVLSLLRWRRVSFVRRWIRYSTRHSRSTASTPISWPASLCISSCWVSTGFRATTSSERSSTSWKGWRSTPATRPLSASVARSNRDILRFDWLTITDCFLMKRFEEQHCALLKARMITDNLSPVTSYWATFLLAANLTIVRPVDRQCQMSVDCNMSFASESVCWSVSYCSREIVPIPFPPIPSATAHSIIPIVPDISSPIPSHPHSMWVCWADCSHSLTAHHFQHQQMNSSARRLHSLAKYHDTMTRLILTHLMMHTLRTNK